MKLIFCKECFDLIRLHKTARKCVCGKSSGYYKQDGVNAVIFGPCIPVGILNSTLLKAITNQPEKGLGKYFTAFILPKKCEKIKHVNI